MYSYPYNSYIPADVLVINSELIPRSSKSTKITKVVLDAALNVRIKNAYNNTTNTKKHSLIKL